MMTPETVVSLAKAMNQHKIDKEVLFAYVKAVNELIMFGACATPPPHYDNTDRDLLREDMCEAKKASDFLYAFGAVLESQEGA